MVRGIESIKHAVCGLLVGALLWCGGCNRRVYFLREEDVGRYEKTATGIAWPDVHEPSSAAVRETLPPRTLTQPNTPHGPRDMTLEECIRIALSNSKVIRDLGARVLQSPEGTPTVYDPAIRASDPRSGVEAALSAFDANFTSNITWSRTDRPVNNAVSVGNLIPTLDAFIFEEDAADFLAELSKTAASGTRVAVRNRIDYRLNNAGSNRFPSAWNDNVEFEIRQPLLRNSGVEFNRIAGPATAPGFFFPNGVLLARINEDLAIAQFQRAIRDLVSQVEDTYWSLYFAYRELGAQVKARDAALETWQKVHQQYQEGTVGGGLANESQAREQFFRLQEAVDATKGGSLRFVTDTSASGGLYGIERSLRRLMGLPANDGWIIRPADEPVTAPLAPDWPVAISEALTQRIELRQQKWVIKQRELALIAAKNFLKPQLDLTALYRYNGFGDDLLTADSDNARFRYAVETLTSGQFTDWSVGLQFSMDIGFRQALSAVRNAELQLVRDRMVLQAQEDEIANGVQGAFQALDTASTRVGETYNRWKAAQDNLRASKEEWENSPQRVSLTLLLNAQQTVVQAESAYYRSAVDYTLALKQLEFEKGTLLAYNNIRLTEGSWPAKAYENSFQRASERYHARPVDVGITEPPPFVDLRDRGASSTVGSAADAILEAPHDEAGPESFPAAPAPADEEPRPLPPAPETEEPKPRLDAPAPVAEGPRTGGTLLFRLGLDMGWHGQTKVVPDSGRPGQTSSSRAPASRTPSFDAARAPDVAQGAQRLFEARGTGQEAGWTARRPSLFRP